MKGVVLMDEKNKKYIDLKELQVYQLARELSREAWKIYERMDWQDKSIMGNQFIRAVDSIGANIAEGYKRYHYLDQLRFYYTSRASLSEACTHWAELLREREKITIKEVEELKIIEKQLSIKLANFIRATYKAKDNK